MKVKELMVKDVLTCAQDDPVMSVAKKMTDQGIGLLVVVEDNLSKHPVGVITDQDLISKVLIKKLDPNKTTVNQVATKNIISISPTATIGDAVVMMKKNQIKRLVVLDDLGALVGIISRSDIIQQFLEVRKQLVDLSTFEI